MLAHALYALYAHYMADLSDPRLRRRMREGRLQQITEYVARIESDLADVRELITRIQRDDADTAVAPMPGDRSVTSSLWESRPAAYENSAGL